MASLAVSLFDWVYLLLGTLVSALIVLVVYFIGSWIRKKLLKRFPKLSWIQSVFAALFCIVFVLCLLAYFFPAWSTSTPNYLEQPPGETTPILDSVISFIVQIARLVFVSAVFSILLIPIALLGDAAFQYFSKKRKRAVSLFGAAWVCVLFTVLLLFAFPWIPAGFAYFLFYF